MNELLPTPPLLDTGGVPTITAAAEQRLIQWLPGTTVRVILDGPATAGQLSIVEIQADQPYRTPTHVHHGDDEIFLVLDGAIRV